MKRNNKIIRWKDARTGLLVLLAAAACAALMPTLNGCSSETPGVERLAEAVGYDRYTLSDEGTQELTRFNGAFVTYATDPSNTLQLKQFSDAFKRVRATYVREVSDEELIDAALLGLEDGDTEPRAMPAKELVETALDAMTASLDPHSVYLNADELREAELVTSGEFGGLGIQVAKEEERIKVIAPIADTPADRAGIKPGDLITHVDGRSVADMRLMEAVNSMRGEPGTVVTLTVERGQGAPFDVDVVRDIIIIDAVRWRVEGDVGYMRIVAFNERVGEDVENAMAEMMAEMGPNGKGIVVDLRNNPGGLFDQSLAVADSFLDSGAIVTVRGRHHGQDRSFNAVPGDAAKGLPMVVLINSGAASAAEIVAAALQDNGRATIMGTPSFGKGSVQTRMSLPIEGALQLTTALYYAPSGDAIQARGVVPDVMLVGIEEGEAEQRESDLPGALPEQGDSHHSTQANLDVSACPVIKEDDREDRQLGCAVGLLRADSAELFLASGKTGSAF